MALSQSQINLLPMRCCMGVVNQITDLDNSSKARPCNFDTFIFMQNNMQIISFVTTSKPAVSAVFQHMKPPAARRFNSRMEICKNITEMLQKTLIFLIIMIEWYCQEYYAFGEIDDRRRCGQFGRNACSFPKAVYVGKSRYFADSHAVFIAVLSMAGKNESDKKFVKEKKEWQRNLLRWY